MPQNILLIFQTGDIFKIFQNKNFRNVRRGHLFMKFSFSQNLPLEILLTVIQCNFEQTVGDKYDGQAEVAVAKKNCLK